MSRVITLMLTLFVLLPGMALASVTAGTIKGVTVDEGGLAIPGVLMTVKSDNMMGFRQLETDGNGRYLFIELPPGIYELSAEKAGFAKIVKPKLQVNIGRTLNLTIELPLASEGQEMIIEESRPVIDTESATRGSVLTKEFLERIPAGRSYQSAVQLAAGVTGGANANIGGAAYNENSYMLDGVNITDPVTGTFSLNFNFDAIEQIQVLTSAFDPEYGYNLGGSINVVTETGGNTLEVKTGLYHTNGSWSPKLDARYAADGTELTPTDFDSRMERYEFGVKVSGPIIRDKAWFVGTYQMTRTLIANSGVEEPRDFDAHYIFSKLTWQPSSAHRFTLLGQTDPTTIDNVYQGSRFVKPEAQGRQAQGGFLMSAQWDWYISPEQFLETKTLVQKSFIERYGVPCTHDKGLGYHPCGEEELENSVDFVTPGRIGTYNAFDSGNEYIFDFDDRWRASIQSKFSLLQVDMLGTHDLKVGIDADYTAWKRIFGYTGNIYFVDLNQLSYNPDTLSNYYWIEVSSPLFFQTHSNHYGLFFQDAWKPIENLTIRYGTRYDRSEVRNDVGESIIDVGLWGPRFSAIWDPFADAKTKIVGSIGRFNDSGRMAIPYYLSEGDIGSKLYLGEYFGEFTNHAANDYSYSPIENTNTVMDGTIAPRSDEFLVGAEREIIQDLAVQLYFTGKYTRYLYAFDELNLIWDQDGYNVIGSGDDTFNTYHRLRTPDLARRDYYRTDVGMQKVWSNRWELQGTYSYTVSRGSVQTSPSSFLSQAPQIEYYLNGLLGTDIKHDITGGFAWEIPNDPWTTEVGGTFFMESGYPLSRYYSNATYYGSSSILKAPVGTYARSETWWSASILIRQAIPVRKGELKGVIELSNLTNRRSGDGAYVSFDNRWIIYNRQDPVEIMVGGVYEF
jgi:hypothetical protein